MKYLTAILVATIASGTSVLAESSLLEDVKRNPVEAITLCKRFESLNKQGISASSQTSINEISRQKNLTAIDAEILTTYVRGLHCPGIF